MPKIKVIVNVPDNDCAKCMYYNHWDRETGYQCYEDHYVCKLYGGVELRRGEDGKFQRCVACQSCEIE